MKHFASFLGRSPNTATPEDLRAYQLQMTKDLVGDHIDVCIISLRFFFSVTCGREEMKRYMQFHRQPRKLPVVLSVEEVAKLLASVPGPGLSIRRPSASATRRGCGLQSSCNLKIHDIDSQRMLIHVDQGKGSKDRQAMLSPSLLEVLRVLARSPGPKAVSGDTEDLPSVVQAVEPRLHGGQGHGGDMQTRDPAHSATQLRHAPVGGQHRREGDPGAAGSCQS